MLKKKLRLTIDPIRYRTVNETEQSIIKKIEESLNVKFNLEENARGIEEKMIIAESVGIEIILSIWHDWQDKNELVFQLWGRSTVYNDYKKEDILYVGEYFRELLKIKNFPDWYIPSDEELNIEIEVTDGA